MRVKDRKIEWRIGLKSDVRIKDASLRYKFAFLLFRVLEMGLQCMPTGKKSA